MWSDLFIVGVGIKIFPLETSKSHLECELLMVMAKNLSNINY